MQASWGSGSPTEIKGKPAGVIGLVIGLLFLGAALVFLSVGGVGGTFGFVICTVAGGGLAFASVRILMSFAAFELAELTSTESAMLGGEAVIWLRLNPKKPLTINGARLVIYGEEYAHYSAGTRSRTYRDKTWEQVKQLEMPRVLQSSYQVDLKVFVPRSAQPTFNGNHNKLRTLAKFELDIDRWPDLTLETELHVRAEYA